MLCFFHKILHPMNYIDIAPFYRYYMMKLMDHDIKATDKEDGPILRDFFMNYHIWSGINNIADSPVEIKVSSMKGSWKKIMPSIYRGFYLLWK
ncbi:hypothetical protein HZS_649 [Henneguya salminicola]|nr:hypothetical protein HZS_649 [Henneguya salminicola]